MAKLIIIKNSYAEVLEYTAACIIRFCGYTSEPAEQCALLVKEMGQCVVLEGNIEMLKKAAKEFKEVGLETKIIK